MFQVEKYLYPTVDKKNSSDFGDGTSRDPFSYRRERVDETLSRPDEICLLNKKRDTITEAICGHYRVVITYMCVI